MRIEDNSAEKVTVAQIAVGDCFKFGSGIFLKTNYSETDNCRCINLYNGVNCRFSDKDVVIPVKAKVVVE